MKRAASITVILLSVLWFTLVLFTERSGEQRSPFLCDWDGLLLDWHVARLCTVPEQPYTGEGVGEAIKGWGAVERANIANPPLVMLMLRWIPAGTASGWCFSAVGLALYLAASFLFLKRRCGRASALDLAALAMCFPVIFAVWVGNTILYAAAAATVFLALYDSDSRRERVIAALMLALAFAMKISPVFLGALYFGRGFRRRFPEAVIAATAGAALLLVPFVFYGGVDGFLLWRENAAANALVHAFRNPIGIYGMAYSAGYIIPLLHQVSGFIAVELLGMQMFREGLSKIVLAVVGMLMLPPTMMIYTIIYLLPAALAFCSSKSRPVTVIAAFTFVMLGCPLQIFFGSFALQPFLMAFAVLVAMALGFMPDRSVGEGQPHCG